MYENRCRRPGCKFNRKPKSGQIPGKYHPTCSAQCRSVERASEGLLNGHRVSGRDHQADALELVRLIDLLNARDMPSTHIGGDNKASLRALDTAYRTWNT
jgi:hypothetical protein